MTLRFLQRYPDRLFVIEYERLFLGDELALHALFEELSLAAPSETAAEGWTELSEKKLVKKPGQDEFIAANADWSKYHSLLRKTSSDFSSVGAAHGGAPDAIRRAAPAAVELCEEIWSLSDETAFERLAGHLQRRYDCRARLRANGPSRLMRFEFEH